MPELFSINTPEDSERIVHILDALANLDISIQINNDALSQNSMTEELRNKTRASLVFWSNTSHNNSSIRELADKSQQENKLIHILIDNLRLSQIPEPVEPDEIIRLSNWSGNQNDPEWKKLTSHIKSKITPIWVKEQLQQERDNTQAERENTQIEISKAKNIQDLLDKEINDHNIFRQRNAEHIANLNASEESLRNSETALREEKQKTEQLTKELAKFTKRKFSTSALSFTALATLLIGMIGVYVLLTMPIKKHANEITKTLIDVKTVHASTVKQVSALKSTAQEKERQTSSALKNLSIIEEKYADLKSYFDKLKKQNQSLLEKNNSLQTTLTSNADALNQHNDKLSSLKNDLDKTKKELAQTKSLASKTQKAFEATKKKLQTAETANNTIKKNAYAEIANIKKNYSREISTLRKRIIQLQKSKPQAQ